MKYIYTFLILLTPTYLFSDNISTCSNLDITNMYSSYIEEWKLQANEAFDEAEKEILSKPAPTPDDVVGPHPDPIKCICKGTGIIIQGDNHKTPCPFHSGQSINTRTKK